MHELSFCIVLHARSFMLLNTFLSHKKYVCAAVRRVTDSGAAVSGELHHCLCRGCCRGLCHTCPCPAAGPALLVSFLHLAPTVLTEGASYWLAAVAERQKGKSLTQSLRVVQYKQAGYREFAHLHAGQVRQVITDSNRSTRSYYLRLQ